MTLNRQILAGLVLAFVAASAQAEWKGKGEAGIVFARGNTQSDTINLKLGMSQEDAQWKHALELAALRGSNGGVTNADRYMAGWQSNYTMSARTFWFGGLRYENDKFSGFDYQASASTGVGYKFYDTDKIKLSGQVGLGYRRLKTTAITDPPPGVPSDTSGNAVFVAGFDYENVLTATTKVVDKFHVESGSDNTLLSNFLGLEVKMSDALALSAGLDVHQNTKPPVDKKKTDTITTLNLVYAF
jgi:putative salt-induced outer membrane protein